MQDERQYFWIDKTRPNNKAVFEFADFMTDDNGDEYENEDGETLMSWAENCEVGGEWDTLTERYTRIK
jgi:hypothetical protein